MSVRQVCNQCESLDEVKQFLTENFPVWTVTHNACYLGVSDQFYRRHVLSAKNHPTPIDGAAAQASWWAEEMRRYFADLSKVKSG